MAEVNLTKGKVAVIGDEDRDLILSYGSWHAKFQGNHWYAAHGVKRPGKDIYMHRLLTGAAKGEVVDHVNGDSLDNRRANIRITTQRMNLINMRAKPSEAGLKGVTRNGNRWQSRIRVYGKRMHLGLFATEQEAHEAYVKAATELFGEFARAA